MGTEELSGSASEQESQSLAPLTVRMKQLQNYMDDLPRNKEDKERLLTCGYNKDIWSEVWREMKKTYTLDISFLLLS